MQGNRLYKYEKLRSRTYISDIFSDGQGAISYPLRAVFKIVPREQTPAQFLITIPKKKIRTAVGRVLLRRRTREAYRLHRDCLIPALDECNLSVHIAFIYLDSKPAEYALIEEKMISLLKKISDSARNKAANQNSKE
jgi:RNase P protein component